MGSGSGTPSRRPSQCVNCHRAELRGRTERRLELRKAGLTNAEIAAKEDVTVKSITYSLMRSRVERYGLEWCPAPRASISYLVYDPNRSYVEEDRGYETPCWIWAGAKTDRYGQAWDQGRNRYVGAHIWHYEQRFGPVGEGLELDHLCRQTFCANPDHLEAVSHQENVRRGANTRLNVEAVRAMRALDAQHLDEQERGGERRRAPGWLALLAEFIGVKKQTVAAILNQPHRYWTDAF